MDSSNNFTLGAWLLAAYIITAKPRFLLHLAKNAGGRAILIALVFATAFISSLAGAALGMAFVVIASDVTEGMKSSRKTTQSPDSVSESNNRIANLRQSHCKSKDGKTLFVDNKGNSMTLQEIQQKYPNIDFSGDACNPCDDACAFTVTETTDQITIETALQPTTTTTEPMMVTK
jgi:hypothetical protein